MAEQPLLPHQTGAAARRSAPVTALSPHEILSDLRHELRTPINTIVGYSEMWLDDALVRNDASLSRDLGKLLTAGHQLHSLINDILDPSKHDIAGDFDLRGVGVVLRHAFRMPAYAILGYSTMLAENLDPGMAPAAEFLTDLRRIEQETQRLLAQADAVANNGQFPSGEVFVASEMLLEQMESVMAKFRAASPSRAALTVTQGKILIVEDDAANGDVLARQLKRLGYTVTIAQDGVSALEMIAGQEFDLVLLDILMPVMSGIEMLKSLRCAFNITDLPVIMVTARDESDQIVRALECGANDYVTKPFTLPVVTARIRTQLLLKYVAREQEMANRKLEALALLDALTQVANRRCFDQTFDREWRRAQRNNTPLSLIMLDIDCFKRYNDTCGHEAGDAVLCRVAATVSQSVARGGDMTFRYGGEEFVVLLPGCLADGARMIAERIRAGIYSAEIPHPASSVAPYVTVSVGAATVIDTNAMKPTELFHCADQAMYLAKSCGRNCVYHADGDE